MAPSLPAAAQGPGRTRFTEGTGRNPLRSVGELPERCRHHQFFVRRGRARLLRRREHVEVIRMSEQNRVDEGRIPPTRPTTIKPGGGSGNAGRVPPTRPPKQPPTSNPKK